jgi:hypothetical protein
MAFNDNTFLFLFPVNLGKKDFIDFQRSPSEIFEMMATVIG